MRRTLAALALALALPLAACGGGSKCDALAKKICSGKSDAHSKKMKEWLSSEMTGPDGKALGASEKDQACGMILDDSTVLSAYTAEAERKLAK